MESAEVIQQGTEAKVLLESPAFLSVFEELDNELRSTMFKTSPEDSKRREELYYMVINLAAIKTKLVDRVVNAEYETQLEKDNQAE